jgi:endoglycosylceramidase
MLSRRRVVPALAAAALVAGPALPAGAARSGLLDGLSRPHPKFISGTAAGSTYSPKTHVYDMRYTTQRPDGSGRFPANSVSGWEIPKAAYPKGYQVKVKGGFVVSGTDAEELLIASGRKATTIHLIIKPASTPR